MSESKANIKALQDLENEAKRIPTRWAGVVEKNHGKYEIEDKDLKGQKLWSGEWYIEIWSKSLFNTVFARVNVDRKESDQVQFNLDEKTNFPAVAGVVPQYGAKGSVVGTPWFKDHAEWREGMCTG